MMPDTEGEMGAESGGLCRRFLLPFAHRGGGFVILNGVRDISSIVSAPMPASPGWLRVVATKREAIV